MLQLALRPLATLADTPPATGRTADTNDWDTVFALPFDRVNPAIATNWTAIEAKPDPINDNSTGYNITYTLDITFGPWQVALGGDGKNIDFTCPVTSGTYTVQLNDPDLVGKPKTYPFPTNPNSQIAIEVGMQWIPDPAEPYVGLSGSDVPTIRTALTGDQIPSQLVTDLQPHKITLSSSATVAAIDPSQPSLAWKITDGANAYYLFYKTDKEDNEYIFVYQFGKAWAGNLTVLSEQLGANSPPVTIRGIVNNPVPTKEKANAAMLESILSAWFNDNLDVFNHVFATLNISAELDTNDKWQWLTPTGTSYAVVDGGTISQSVFGVLTMTGGRPALSNHEISPNAIPADGSDTGFLIPLLPISTTIQLPGRFKFISVPRLPRI